MAVSASHARDRTTTNRALSALTERNESRPTTWTTVAEVALANHRFEPADVAARKALEADPHLARAWFDLAASYAGRGWFDEATDCLRRAQHLDRSEGSSLGEWRVGRAVNWWAITKTPAAAVTLLSALFVGILGLAVGLSTPLLVREFRIRSLDDSYTTMAIDAWENEHRFRVLNALAVAGVIVAWVLLFTLTR